jgi:hypothetical protein
MWTGLIRLSSGGVYWTQQWTIGFHIISISKSNWLVMFREIIVIYHVRLQIIIMFGNLETRIFCFFRKRVTCTQTDVSVVLNRSKRTFSLSGLNVFNNENECCMYEARNEDVHRQTDRGMNRKPGRQLGTDVYTEINGWIIYIYIYIYSDR